MSGTGPDVMPSPLLKAWRLDARGARRQQTHVCLPPCSAMAGALDRRRACKEACTSCSSHPRCCPTEPSAPASHRSDARNTATLARATDKSQLTSMRVNWLQRCYAPELDATSWSVSCPLARAGAAAQFMHALLT